MRDHPCRFIFSDADAELINRTTLEVEDLPLSNDWPQGLRLRCKTLDNERIMVIPLAQCKMRFLVDPSAPGILPKPEDVALDDASYLTWKVIGTLIWDFEKVAETFTNLASALLVKPTRIWLGPVTIPKDFLFDSLIKKDRLHRGPLRLKKIVVGTTPSQEFRWQQHAIADFLSGEYNPLVRFHKDDPIKDDAIRLPMPLMGFKPAENIHEIMIYAAAAGFAQDALDKDWDPGKSRDEAKVERLKGSHPRNGVVPARLVYQDFRSHMVPAESGRAQGVRDDITEPALGPRAFSTIRFTRTRNPIANVSIHFPRHTVVFRNESGTELRRQRLPAHGILWVDADFFINSSAGTTISLEGGMRWLPAVPNTWQFKGLQDPLPMTTGPEPQHIVLRLPMSMAMLEDRTRPLGEVLACTYLSMRRTVRALIDNRISGGRLNKNVYKTDKTTRDLFTGTLIRANSVAGNMPDPSGSPNTEAPKLLPMLEGLFPGDCEQHPIEGVPPPSDPTIVKQGKAAYWLWQTALKELKDAKTVRNISDQDMGRGAAGAVVSLGIAAYHLNMPPPPGAGTEYIDQLVGLMVAGLEQAATTQLWHSISQYRDLIDRTKPPPGLDPAGHSPIFVKYRPDTGPVTGLTIIDQGGQHTYPISGAPPNRSIHGAEVWITANWTE